MSRVLRLDCTALAGHLQSLPRDLGLERRPAPVPDLAEYLARRAATAASQRAPGRTAGSKMVGYESLELEADSDGAGGSLGAPSRRDYAQGDIGCTSHRRKSDLMMDGSDRVEFADVEVISDTGILLICRIGPQRVALPPQCMLPGTEIARAGDRGRLVLSRAEAVNLALMGPAESGRDPVPERRPSEASALVARARALGQRCAVSLNASQRRIAMRGRPRQ